GTGFGPQDSGASAPDASGLLPTSLAGVRVLFDGMPAPILGVSLGQVGAVVPYSLSGKTRTQVQVEYQGVPSNPITVPVAAVAPGVFTADSSGSGQARLLNEDWSENSPANPAARGSAVLFFATGTGLIDPPGVDGLISQEALATPVAAITARVGGIK